MSVQNVRTENVPSFRFSRRLQWLSAVMTPCSLVDGCQHFGRTCCQHILLWICRHTILVCIY